MFYSWAFIIRAPLKKVSLRSGLAGPPHPTYLSPWQERLPLEVFQKTSNRDAIDFFFFSPSPPPLPTPPSLPSTWAPAYILSENLKRERKGVRERVWTWHNEGWDGRKVWVLFVVVCLTSIGTQKRMNAWISIWKIERLSYIKEIISVYSKTCPHMNKLTLSYHIHRLQ